MKKGLKFLLALFSLLIITGCGNKKDELDNKTNEEEYNKAIEGEVFDTFGDYTIYTDNGKTNIVNNKTKTIIASGKTSIVATLEECGDNPTKCDYYVYGIENNTYFVNRSKKIISEKSYGYAGISCFFDQGEGTISGCFGNPNVLMTHTGDSFGENSEGKYGLLDVNTGKDIIEPKFDDLLYLGNNKFAGRINGKVGLYSGEGKEILKPEYDYIGHINDGSIFVTDFYVTIKGNEIKLYNKDMKEQQDLGNYMLDSFISDSTNMRGVYKLYNNKVSFLEVDDINSNDYFNYKGSDYKGKYVFVILYAPCENHNSSKDNEPLILVINNKKLSKLNPSLIELKEEVCEFE